MNLKCNAYLSNPLTLNPSIINSTVGFSNFRFSSVTLVEFGIKFT